MLPAIAFLYKIQIATERMAQRKSHNLPLRVLGPGDRKHLKLQPQGIQCSPFDLCRHLYTCMCTLTLIINADKLKMKEWESKYYVTASQKRAEVAVLLLDNVNFMLRGLERP